jgi:hypothetical protein
MPHHLLTQTNEALKYCEVLLDEQVSCNLLNLKTTATLAVSPLAQRVIARKDCWIDPSCVPTLIPQESEQDHGRLPNGSDISSSDRRAAVNNVGAAQVETAPKVTSIARRFQGKLPGVRSKGPDRQVE